MTECNVCLESFNYRLCTNATCTWRMCAPCAKRWFCTHLPTDQLVQCPACRSPLNCITRKPVLPDGWLFALVRRVVCACTACLVMHVAGSTAHAMKNILFMIPMAWLWLTLHSAVQGTAGCSLFFALAENGVPAWIVSCVVVFAYDFTAWSAVVCLAIMTTKLESFEPEAEPKFATLIGLGIVVLIVTQCDLRQRWVHVCAFLTDTPMFNAVPLKSTSPLDTPTLCADATADSDRN